MSKQEVLTQVYPDELKYIFRNKREDDIQRYEDYRNTMVAIAAGMGAKTESGESLYKLFNQQIDEVINYLDDYDKEVKEKEYTPEMIDNELDKLRGLQGVINQNHAKRRR